MSIAEDFAEHLAVSQAAAQTMVPLLERAAEALGGCLRAGGKVLACGNGGSAADAQHFVAELVGRYQRTRAPLAAIALSTDSSILTAVANDFGFEAIFARQVAALARPGDVLVAISTSGNSPNVLAAAEAATAAGCRVIALTGGDGGRLAALAELVVAVPSTVVARIQEMHELALHALCRRIEIVLEVR